MIRRYKALAEEIEEIVDGDLSLEDEDDCGCGSLKEALNILGTKTGIERKRLRRVLRNE
jgi:hypothetical protein